MSARKARLGRGRSIFGSVRKAHLGRGRLLLSGVSRFAMLGLAAVFVYLPGVAGACSVCSAGRDDENAAAFLISTIFMSALPLIAIGAIGYGLVRRVRKFEAEKEALAATRRVSTAPLQSAP